MFKINQKAIKISKTLLNSLVIILTIFLNSNITVYGAEYSWFEVSKTPEGIQYVDKNSLTNKGKNILEITTKYSKIDPNTSVIIEDNIYVMRINCSTYKFSDISVNGKKNFSAKWEAPNGDKLLFDVISKSCKNA